MGLKDKKKFLNREYEWLKFNERVFQLAKDKSIPLLERINFFNIYHTNLDEFFMKRVGGLKRQVYSTVSFLSMDGRTSEEQLMTIRERVLNYQSKICEYLTEDLIPALNKKKIHLLSWDDLKDDEKEIANDFFDRKMFAVLTPMAVDQGHPFPLISNLSLSLAVSLRHSKDEDLLFARIKMPKFFPKWMCFDYENDEKAYRFVSVVDIVRANIKKIFPNMIVENTMDFRITRNIDISNFEDEDVEDLLESIVEEVKQRKFSEVVRLEVPPNADEWLLDFLVQELELEEDDIYPSPIELCYYDLSNITRIYRPKLKYKPWQPLTPIRLQDKDQSIFNIIKYSELLVHHPYESFAASVERFIITASEDPNVVAIKVTLYRVSEDSPIVKALINAADSGKHVVCLIELKARLEEERNIQWAQKLENAGVHVVYGIVGLKTHSKLALVVRREGDEYVPYVHIGTGNYNGSTAKIYEDVSYFTRDPDIAQEAVELFHFLTGRSNKADFKHLIVAPINLRAKILEYIEVEKNNAVSGKAAGIFLKCNSLQDKQIIDALYDASQHGVSIKLIIRGFSSLIPGRKGLSENIELISVLGRFLEHSRIYCFKNGNDEFAEGRVLIGSADLMERNLKGRVEVVAPIRNPGFKGELTSFLDILWKFRSSSWQQIEDTYKKRDSKSTDEHSAQDELMRIYTERSLVNSSKDYENK